MGDFAIKPAVKVVAWLITSILVYLNGQLLINEIFKFFETPDSVFRKLAIVAGGLFLILLLMYVILFPFLHKKSGISASNH